MNGPRTLTAIDVYVFYFDVVGFVESFLDRGQDALDQLRLFQRQARRAFSFSHQHSYIVTLYDNVWCRINASEPGTPSLILDLAGEVMRAATAHGFHHFFGSITRGMHDYDSDDRMLAGGESFEDLKEQHLDTVSEPHIRAAYAERWRKVFPSANNSVWVSCEVVDPMPISALAIFPSSTFVPTGTWFDLAPVRGEGDHAWRFGQSRFHAIRAKQ